MSEAERRENVPRESGFDRPVDDPSGDLLDMDQQARALADFIRSHLNELPFTLGVYAGWGEGKTTFVNFLKHHLEHPECEEPREINFVRFSAWSYTTSEKLWRALIVAIADSFYKKKTAGEGAKQKAEAEKSKGQKPEAQDSGEQKKEKQKSGARGKGEEKEEESGLLKTVSRFLSGDALVLREPPPERDDYAELMRELEETDFGEVGRPRGGAQLDEGAAMAAVLGGAMTALGTVSPLFASLRSFFNLGPKVEAADIIRREQAQARGKVEALSRFQKIYARIIEQREETGPVFIFIDDLDRAQPDVALNIVESIRLALWEPHCVFIIAIDESLIARGLWLRFKEQFPAEELGEFQRTKGQEYLEKIIQLRVLLPTRTPEQLQRFIASQYPEWLAAGDFIQMVVGSNPRRLKQYCLRLNFQATVGVRALGSARRRATPSREQEGAASAGEGWLEEEVGEEMPKDSLSPELQQLHGELFDLNTRQLEYILNELNINFEKLVGTTKAGKLKTLLLACEEENALDKLKELLEKVLSPDFGVVV